MVWADQVLEQSLILACRAEQTSQRGRELCGHSRDLIEMANARVDRFYRKTRFRPDEPQPECLPFTDSLQRSRILQTDRVEGALVVEFEDHRCAVFQADRLYALMVSEQLEVSDSGTQATEGTSHGELRAEAGRKKTGLILPFPSRP